MTLPANPTRYPGFLRAAVEKLDRTPSEPLVFPCVSHSESRYFQLLFSCFKKAALNAGWEKDYPTLGVIVAQCDWRSRDPGDPHLWDVTLRNIEAGGRIARWGKAVGVDEPEDLEPPKAYQNR